MKPTTDNVRKLINGYYAKPGNSNGGALHVVLEDGNIRDSDIEFCIDKAEKAGDLDGISIGALLLQMSKTQRRKLCNTK